MKEMNKKIGLDCELPKNGVAQVIKRKILDFESRIFRFILDPGQFLLWASMLE